MPQFAVDGARLHYSVCGRGRPVVALHGLMSNIAHEASAAHDWQAALGDAHTVIAYDARGHGRSTGRAVPDDYRWDALADDLLALLDEIAPDEPVDGIGASMGTATLLHAAIKAPGRFRRLVLTIPPTAWQTRAAQSETYLQTAELVEQEGMRAFRLAFAAQPQPPVMTGRPVDLPVVDDALLPSILRGAAATDLPEPQSICKIEAPTLLLPWVGDPGHPVETSRQLLDLLIDADLRLAETADDWSRWPESAREHLAG